MKVVMSGGGTAGHIYPALTVAATLVAARDEVAFIGTPQGLEARLVPDAGIAFRGLPSRGFDRARPFSLITAVVVAVASAVRAWSWLGAARPDIVMGFGGYVSLPVGLAAVVRGIPLVLHEQNSVPGLANRVLSRWATRVGLTYEESAAGLRHPERAVVTGNPVRDDVLTATRSQGRELLGVDDDALLLLVFGGSRGARHLNQALVDAKDALLALPQLTVVHVTGPGELEAVSARLGDLGSADLQRWRVYGYWAQMGSAIAAADLVLCRSGATTLAELTALGAPSIVVPYPFATDDHQTKNARTMVEHGAALLVDDKDLDSDLFSDTLLKVLGDAELRANMAAASRALGRPDAARRVVELARRAAGQTFPPTESD